MDLSNWQSNQQLVCLVSKPDSVVIEVQVDRNGIGQDILDKVNFDQRRCYNNNTAG